MRLPMIAFALATVLFAASASAQEQMAYAILLKVNDKTITQEQVREMAQLLVKREYNSVMPEDEEELEIILKAAIRELARTHLIHYDAAANGIHLSREDSKRIMRNSGIPPEEITPTIRRVLEADDLFETLMASSGTPISQPSPREVKAFYLENREGFRTNAFVIVRTIFLPAERDRQSYFKARAEAMIAQLEAVPLSQRTEAFAKQAREYSQDMFAEYGGLLTGDSPEPWIPKEFNNVKPDGSPLLPPTMAEEIRRLNRKGELRLAVSAEGMHLLYCEDVQGGKELSWDEATRLIDFVLKQRVRNERLRAWLSRVYDRSDLRWHDGTRYEKEELTEVLLPSERVGKDAR